MTDVLVIEDQLRLLESIARGLREEGYEVATASNTVEAQQHLESLRIDAIILDLMLPGRDGLSWLRQLRNTGNDHPVIILTARDSLPDCIKGLDDGADDYLVKPFSFDELVARLRAVLRRSRNRREATLHVDSLQIDLLSRQASRAGTSLDLTRRQFELLAFLMRNADGTITREMIAQGVWKEASATWTNVIEVQINHLRRKIERPDWPPILHTIRGVGYMLGERPACN